MWHNTRRGRNLIRKRYTTRQFKLNLKNSLVILACVFVIVTCTLNIINIRKSEKNKNEVAEKPVIEENNIVHIYEEENTENTNNNNVQEAKKEFNIAVLGEIMMGGVVGENVNYNYKTSYKHVYDITQKADYTIATLGTNVINLDKIEDSKSKYITTTKITDAFNTLGIDGLNIATDHMLDFGKDVFVQTKDILDKDYDLIGLKDSITYAEHNGIKVAMIGVCNEIIGLGNKYTEAGIMMYDLTKVKSLIKEASKNANTVIVMTHLGFENTHQKTNVMTWFYKELIKAGADVVLGSHALGVYPIEIYKGKPIIYSLGYFMHDTDNIIGKKSGIFNLIINEEGILEKIQITPTYINAKKQTVLYQDIDSKEAEEFLQYISGDLKESNIKDKILTINIK